MGPLAVLCSSWMLCLGLSWWGGLGDAPGTLASIILAALCLVAVLRLVRFHRWRTEINRSIPGPSGLMPLIELYKAGLGEFWGLNPAFFSALHRKYGKVVKFWMGADLYISFAEPGDILEVHKKCKGRPKLAKILLPFLGEKNLLFQPTAEDHGAFVKQLRLRYGKMVNGNAAGTAVHTESFRTWRARTAHWGDGEPVDVFEETKVPLYDIMGTTLFGQAWMADDTGRKVYRLHRYCIEWSMQMGIKAMKHLTVRNVANAAGDYRTYQQTIRELHAACWGMIEARRREITADPAAWADDTTALTLLCTESDTRGSPFFSKDLAIATCCGFLNGAYDTTHITVYWILYHLARFPEVQARLAAEIHAAVGRAAAAGAGVGGGGGGGDVDDDDDDNEPTFERVRSFEYLHAVIQESLRLQPTVPVNMRENDAELHIGACRVPQGTSIIPYTIEAFRDASVYGGQPERFRPERFMGETQEAKRARLSFSAFGNFSRMCVGFKFAEAELKAIVTFVIQRYRIRLDAASEALPHPPKVVMESGVSAPAEKHRFIFVPHGEIEIAAE